MHGLGNDFVVIDAIRQAVSLNPNQIRFLADRHFGVGCDQVLLVESPTQPGVDFRYRIYNADGGEVEQCGNGARCFARFVREEGLTMADELVVETAAGIIRPRLEKDGQVTVDMGLPRFEPELIPLLAKTPAVCYPFQVGEQTWFCGAVSMGNPHGVLQVEAVDSAPVTELGPLLERHPHFPRRANIGFMEVISPRHIRLRVWERGTGETLACGTGACAAVAVGIRQGLLESQVTVELPGGRLKIHWPEAAGSLFMTGPATRVYDGYLELTVD